MNELALALGVGVVGAAGLYLATSRDLISVVVGIALIGSAANLFVFAMGRLQRMTPPIVPGEMAVPPGAVADPLPQALVLTAIVIGFALACLGLALALRLRTATDNGDADRLDQSEPPPHADGEPGYLP